MYVDVGGVHQNHRAENEWGCHRSRGPRKADVGGCNGTIERNMNGDAIGVGPVGRTDVEGVHRDHRAEYEWVMP